MYYTLSQFYPKSVTTSRSIYLPTEYPVVSAEWGQAKLAFWDGHAVSVFLELLNQRAHLHKLTHECCHSWPPHSPNFISNCFWRTVFQIPQTFPTWCGVGMLLTQLQLVVLTWHELLRCETLFHLIYGLQWGMVKWFHETCNYRWGNKFCAEQSYREMTTRIVYEHCNMGSTTRPVARRWAWYGRLYNGLYTITKEWCSMRCPANNICTMFLCDPRQDIRRHLLRPWAGKQIIRH
jgi:hypothetical protein